MSEESEDEVAGGESLEEMTYRRKYQMLLERCEVLQQDNERLINRIQHVYKYTRQTRKERQFLVKRLEGHNDNWRLGINQYLISDTLNQPSKSKIRSMSSSQKPHRRPSSTSRSKQKEKPPKSHKKAVKEQCSSLGTEKIKLEYDSDNHVPDWYFRSAQGRLQ